MTLTSIFVSGATCADMNLHSQRPFC